MPRKTTKKTAKKTFKDLGLHKSKDDFVTDEHIMPMEPEPKTIKVKKKAKIPDANISEEGSLKIDELTLLRLQRFEAEIRSHRIMLQNHHHAHLELTKKLDPNGLLIMKRNEIEAEAMALHEHEEQYKAVRKELEDRLGIDLNKVSYNDVTGVIHELPDAVEDAKAQKA